MPDDYSDRENCFWLNDSVRQTLAVLRSLEKTATDPVTVEQVAAATGLPVKFCEECLITLAFEEVIRETDSGFQTVSLSIARLDQHSHYTLDLSFDGRNAPRPRVRLRTGEWFTGLDS